MPQCPYPETITNEISGQIEANKLYLVWHEGYETHKFEMANQSIRLAHLLQAFETEVKNVTELKRTLQIQKDKSQGIEY